MSKKRTLVARALVLVVTMLAALGAGCLLLPPAGGDASGPDTELLEEAWDIIHKEYVERDQLEGEALLRGALEGMIDALGDPYSAYLDADAYEISVSGLAGKFEGIGAYVGYDEGKIIILAPIPGSPADQAGLRSGDVIMAVDGESTADMSVTDVVYIIRGPRGTSVRLLVLHEGDVLPVEIDIIRAEIELPSVDAKMTGDIAIIRIVNFTDRTDGELSAALEEITEQAATAIILDLRGNPGGLLSAVVAVAGRFLDEGVVVASVVDNEGNRTDSRVKRSGQVTDLPMVVLVNEFSASGSEVLAGALQDYGRAVVAGTTTHGKGSVNVLRQLSDGSGLYLTTARWYTPNGRRIEGEGIEPDFVLDPEEDALRWALDYLKNAGSR